MSDITLAPDAPLDQIEWRVQGKIDKGDGVQVVAYLDAPTVSRLLDHWVGPDRWKDHYELTGKAGTLWCHLSVKFDDEWITKEDIGTASDMEADKGLVSDAFKRVAMRKWGVGRNVFALPVLRITKFRKVERQGKEPMAYLTGESHAEIAERLRRLGFDDAAKHAENAVVAEVEDEDPAPSEPDVEHQAQLDLLDKLLGQAAEAGVDGDPEAARTYARQSPAHALKAVESVRGKLADARPDEPAAPAPTEDTAPSEAAPSDAEPAETDAAWRQVCDDLGVAKTEVLNTIRKDWANNSGWNKPNRLTDVDRLAATEEFGPLVRAVIEDLHQAVPA